MQNTNITTQPNPIVKQTKSKRRLLRWTVICCVAIILFGCPGIAAYVGWSLTHPSRKPIQNVPETYHLPYQNIEFTSSSDGVHLRGWLIPSNTGSKDRIVVFAHGYTGNRSDSKATLPTANALHAEGIASLMFDFRDSGESDGSSVSVGMYEKGELLSVIQYAKSLGYKNIGLIGYSMGASTAIMAAAESKDVEAVVADSPFADLRPYLEDNMPVWSHLPAFPFNSLILFEIPLLTGMNPDEVRPIVAIQHLQDRPVFLIHAVGDHSIPIQNSELLKQAVHSDNTILWEAPGDHHVGTYEAVPSEYLHRVVDFMIQHLHRY